MNKPVTRVVLGIVGVIGVFFGVRQMISGFRQISGVTVPQKIGERVDMAGHGCSMRVPNGWEKKDGDGGGLVFSSPKSSGYAVNLIVLSEAFAGSLPEYADLTAKSLKDALPDAEIEPHDSFAPSVGAAGRKISLRRKVKEMAVVQSVYIFGGKPGRNISITTTAPAERSAEIEPLFVECLKSFTVLP